MLGGQVRGHPKDPVAAVAPHGKVQKAATARPTQHVCPALLSPLVWVLTQEEGCPVMGCWASSMQTLDRSEGVDKLCWGRRAWR